MVFPGFGFNLASPLSEPHCNGNAERDDESNDDRRRTRGGEIDAASAPAGAETDGTGHVTSTFRASEHAQASLVRGWSVT